MKREKQLPVSSERRQEYAVQREWYYQRNGKAFTFLEVKDIPFDIENSFRSRSQGNSRDVGQIIRLHPVDESVAWNMITREYGRRSLRIPVGNVAGDRSTESNRLTLRNIESMREELAEGKSRIIRYSSSYFIKGDGDELAGKKKALVKYLKKVGIKVEGKRFGDAKIRNRLISGNVNGIYLDPKSVSYLIPINHGYLFDENGAYYGRCDITGAPVFLDRSLLPSSHELVLGMTGFGKSYFVKSTMFREKVARGVELKIVDPLGEYGGVASNLGARSVDMMNMEMNMFEKVKFLTLKENVDRTLALLITLFNLGNEELGVLDSGITKMYEEDQSYEFLKDFVLSRSPQVYNKISPIFDGSFKKFCTGRNPEMSGDVRIDLSKVPKKILPFYMLLSLDLLMRSAGGKQTNLVIDEAHYLLQEDVVGSLERYVRHARHLGTSIILISQSANDFLKSRSSLSIMENCSIHVLFRHQAVTDEMINFYKLDDSLSGFLRNVAGFNGRYSKALLITPHLSTILRFESSEEERYIVDGIR
jgi:hypothetical protein